VRHILDEFLKVFLLCMTAFLAIYYVVDIFNHINIFLSYNASFATKLSHFLYKLPQIIYQVAPVAVLISIVTVVGVMGRHNELTAIKAGGISLRVVALPLLASAFVISLMIFLNNEYLLPSTNRKAIEILDVKIKGKPPRGVFRQNQIWYAGKDDRIFKIDVLDPVTKTMMGVTIITMAPATFRPIERIDAARAVWTDEGWRLEDVVRRNFSPDGRQLLDLVRRNRIPLAIEERFEDFIKFKKHPDELNFSELRSYIERLESSGYNATPYRVDLVAKTAIPFICLVIAFLSVAMAVKFGSRGSVVASVGLCLAVGVAYWLVLSLGISLGHAGRLNPLVASWGANIIFGSIGISLFLSVNN
jgi:lipopolysaccharide export system permease protein